MKIDSLKLSLISAVLFCGLPVLATECPDLAGIYICEFEDVGQDELQITQRVENGITHYSFSDSEFTTDNRLRSLPDTAESKNVRVRSKCNNGSLLSWESGEMVAHDGTYDTYSQVTPIGKDHFMVSGSAIFRNAEITEAVDILGRCTRK